MRPGHGRLSRDGGNIYASVRFKLADALVNGKLLRITGGKGHGALAGVLKVADVDALICGGVGMGARVALSEAGIQLFPGVTGSADEAAAALVAGTLDADPDATCDHHGHGHGKGHDCHHHGGGCGDHGCHE